MTDLFPREKFVIKSCLEPYEVVKSVSESYHFIFRFKFLNFSRLFFSLRSNIRKKLKRFPNNTYVVHSPQKDTQTPSALPSHIQQMKLSSEVVVISRNCAHYQHSVSQRFSSERKNTFWGYFIFFLIYASSNNKLS